MFSCCIFVRFTRNSLIKVEKKALFLLAIKLIFGKYRNFFTFFWEYTYLAQKPRYFTFTNAFLFSCLNQKSVIFLVFQGIAMDTRVTVADLVAAKAANCRIVAVSCYDYTTVWPAAQADVDIILDTGRRLGGPGYAGL
jgi:hypothetical protein